MTLVLAVSILDLLVQKKPIDKDEFFKFVPQDERVNLKPLQSKTYLSDIIEDYV